MRLTEDNYADWLACSASAYFRRKGYEFHSLSIGQVREADFPVDKLFVVGNKLVGLQLKAPESPLAARTGFEYRIRPEQHQTMLQAEPSWMFYALPETDDFRDQHTMHRYTVFAEARDIEMRTSSRFAPRRSISFFQLVHGIEQCPIGMKLPEGFTLEMFLRLARSQPAWAYVLINVRERVVFLARMEP